MLDVEMDRNEFGSRTPKTPSSGQYDIGCGWLPSAGNPRLKGLGVLSPAAEPRSASERNPRITPRSVSSSARTTLRPKLTAC